MNTSRHTRTDYSYSGLPATETRLMQYLFPLLSLPHISPGKASTPNHRNSRNTDPPSQQQQKHSLMSASATTRCRP
eukprot:3860316-Rhodomonas_salina.2